MQTTSPIRRYVLLRQPAQTVSGTRWSMERVAPAPGSARGQATPPVKSAGVRA